MYSIWEYFSYAHVEKIDGMSFPIISTNIHSICSALDKARALETSCHANGKAVESKIEVLVPLVGGAWAANAKIASERARSRDPRLFSPQPARSTNDLTSTRIRGSLESTWLRR